MAKDDSLFPLPGQLVQEVDRLFDELIHRPWGSTHSSADPWNPEVDLYETEAAFVLEVDLPGIREEDVEVTVDKGDLVLRGTRTDGHPRKLSLSRTSFRQFYSPPAVTGVG
jgi:HSP20 family molecular chaperone IbpA